MADKLERIHQDVPECIWRKVGSAKQQLRRFFKKVPFMKGNIHSVSTFDLLLYDYHLQTHFKLINQTFEDLYEIEALYSLAKAINIHKWVFPEITADESFEIIKASNPLIKHCISNSLIFDLIIFR